MKGTRNAYRILVKKLECKRTHGNYRYRCEDTIKMDLQEMRWGSVDYVHLASDRSSDFL
jgi:hypothetical protein